MSIYGTPVGGIVREEDPTVPDWAKEDVKPSYTIDELGLVSETWTFTLSDGTTVTKNVVIK